MYVGHFNFKDNSFFMKLTNLNGLTKTFSPIKIDFGHVIIGDCLFYLMNQLGMYTLYSKEIFAKKSINLCTVSKKITVLIEELVS